MTSVGPLMIVAGEASGDLHGARMLRALRRRFPRLEAFGLGSTELREAGFEAVADSSEISVVGIVEALKILPRARRLFARLVKEAEARRPSAAVLIDSPDFNLRLARPLKDQGISVIYYISPQVWAWRKGRVHTIRRRVDRMLVLFPFEVDFYRRYGMDVTCVGHPLIDEVPQLEQRWQQGAPDQEPYRIALLPGSRRSEVSALLPAMLGAVERLAREVPLYVRLVKAQGLSRSWIEELIADASLSRQVEIVEEDRFAVVADSHLALTASGTATLEVGLLGTPMVVMYRLATWTYWLARRLVRLPHFSLVNLVLGREVVPELLQAEASAERTAVEALAILRDEARRRRLQEGLSELRPRLGSAGASERAAEAVAESLEALA
ncbi:MAG: lipid-A-disaccharide synthase [Acidobacteriota bacterium]